MKTSKSKILFVDDEPQVLFSLAGTFEMDYNVLTAQSGPEALDIIKANRIQVVVSDQRMPDMLGVELLKQVKDLSPTTMRILLTGYSDLDDIIRSVNVGDVFRYVNKPWNVQKLSETISVACQICQKLEDMSLGKTPSGTLPSAPAPKKASNEILFIDRNPLHLMALKELFDNDYAVWTAMAAEEAFNILRSRPIGIIAAEVSLGETDGVDFLAAVKESYPDIVTILLSDSKDANTAIRLINEGRVFRYLVKPFQREMLKSTIREAFVQHSSYAAKPSTNIKRLEDSVSRGPQTVSFQDQSLYESLKRVREKIRARQTY